MKKISKKCVVTAILFGASSVATFQRAVEVQLDQVDTFRRERKTVVRWPDRPECNANKEQSRCFLWPSVGRSVGRVMNICEPVDIGKSHERQLPVGGGGGWYSYAQTNCYLFTLCCTFYTPVAVSHRECFSMLSDRRRPT
jgi:hypothetical protein